MKVYTASGWIAASSASVATLATFEFVATAGQTVFSGNDANGASLSYVAPALIVTLNGVRLRPGDDYTASNGTSITLVSAAALNDELVVDAFGSFLVANTYTIAQADALLANKSNTSTTVTKNSSTGAANLPSGTTAERPGSPVNGMIRNNSTTNFVEVYQGGAWTALSLPYQVEYIVVAGGGGGASYTGSAYVGGNPGSNSSFGSITSVGGGGGKAWNVSSPNPNGGSGGGGGANTEPGGLGTTGQGFAGGTGYQGGGPLVGGGGGGAGAVGGNSSTSVNGNGGVGVQSSINGTATFRAGGGGGGSAGGTAGTGGNGGGGAGGVSSSGSAGATNTGGGGGGGDAGPGAGHGGGGAGGYRSSVSGEGSGGGFSAESPLFASTGTAYSVTVGAGGTAPAFAGNGGSGIVILRYLGAQKGTGGTVTSAGGYTIHTFTSSGTYTA